MMGYKDWNTPQKFNSWSLLLSLKDGDLGISHRRGAGRATEVTLVKNFEFGRDHDIVIGQVMSEDRDGMVEVWIDGKRVYSETSIDHGMGDFDKDDNQGEDSHSQFKLGMYNHSPDDYRDGEVRIVYYDNVTWYTGPDGYDIVDPSN